MKTLDFKQMEKVSGGYECSYNDDQAVVLKVFGGPIGWGLLLLCDER